MRLDKFLCESGIGTRSEVKKLVSKGKVCVNGSPAKDPSVHIDENSDSVTANGKAVTYFAFEYYLLNKPAGYISASKADMRSPDVPCVIDLIDDRVRNDLFPVGRLDKDTEGLLLITNDGDLAHRLLSPKKHVDKEYYVELDGIITDEIIPRLEAGVDIGDETKTLPARLEKLSDTSCLLTIHEGRYHQVKRMFEAFGLTVTYLRRNRMGEWTLGDLKTGEHVRIDIKKD